MSEKPEDVAEEPKKKSKLPLLIGILGMVIGGGGGFYAVYSGLILAPSEAQQDTPEKGDSLEDVAFVPVESLVVSLGPDAGGKFLHFSSQLEVEKASAETVTALLPRVVDVLNEYLRAVATSELEDPASLIRLRAQMLRRVQMVAGKGHVRDLLISEFIIN